MLQEHLAKANEANIPKLNPREIPVGVVGLGLMGRSITTCLLAAGHPVAAISREVEAHESARNDIYGFLEQMTQEGMLTEDRDAVIKRMEISYDFDLLTNREIVIESIVESVEAKKQVLGQIEAVVVPDTVIGSNTSSIPVSILQQGAKYPERILGVHWAEPAHITRFMEIICGDRSQLKYAERILAIAQGWGKEPSLLRRDIRGFITNRLFYALLREAFHLIGAGYTNVEDVDRSLRNDLGYWMTFAGPFRFMDLTGIPAYLTVLKDLWPELNCGSEPPAMLEELVKSGALGIANAKGFYNYSPEEAKAWEKAFVQFTYDIRRLALKYR
jgi:3-hydroxybutyryl-CoA dehydrogenase